MTEQALAPLGTRPKVLLVDDDARMLAGLRRQLHGRYQVFVAESGDEGLKTLETVGSFAVVISDMRMPGMDGASFLAQVRTASPQTTRILLTGQTELNAAIRALNDGQIFRFLNKPCTPETLDKCLDEAIARYGAAHDRYRQLASLVGDRRVLDSEGGYEELAVELQAGLEQGEFRMQYQPIVDLADGRVVAVEALIRWAHADGGLVQAAGFVPLAEASGLIVPLGRWTMAAACQEVASWPALAATEDLQVHINLSGEQLRDPQLVDDLAGTLILSGLEANRITMEIAESPALDEPLPVQSLQTMATWGVHLALSVDREVPVGLLQRLSFDTVKIGRRIGSTLPTDPEAQRICRSIVEAAKHLRLRTVAEGIETPEQQRAGRMLGCDLAQGYLYGWPTYPSDLLIDLAGDGLQRSDVTKP